MQRVLLLFLFPALLPAQDSLHLTATATWADPTLPSSAGVRYNDIWGYTDDAGREYAILGTVGATLFFDLADPANPTEVARIPGQLNSIWRDYKTYGHYAYMAADQGAEGLTIFDLSQLPDTVTQVYQSSEFFLQAHNLFIDEAHGRLYAAGTNNPFNGVIVLDLSQDPASPTLLGAPVLPAGGYIHDLFVQGHIAYCSHGGNGFSVYDLSEPTAPVTLGTLSTYPEQGYNHSSWLHPNGQHLVFADETFGTSLKLVDVSDLQEMEVISLFKSELLAPQAAGSIAHNPFIRGQYAVVSYYHDGVQVFDLSEPAQPIQMAYYDTYPQNTDYQGYEGCWGVYPFLPSELILASDITNGLFVLQPQGWSFDGHSGFFASIAPSGSVKICAGESLTLNGTVQGEGWAWAKDGELIPNTVTDSLIVTAPGTYYLVNATGTFPAYSDSLRVELVQTPSLNSIAGTYTYCPGQPMHWTADTASLFDTLFLFQPPAPVPVDSSTAGTFLLPGPGTFHLIGVVNGCTAASPPFSSLRIPEAEAPVVAPFIPPLCEGDSLHLTVASPQGYTYSIPTLAQTFPDTGYLTVPAGLYEAEAVNNGCDTSFVVGEEPAPRPSPALSQVGDSLVCGSPSSGLYIWLRDGQPVDTTSTPAWLPQANGTYQVGILNNAFCLGYSAPFEYVANPVREWKRNALRIWPNPATSRIHLRSSFRIARLAIYDARGQKVLDIETPAPAIDIQPLPQGMYWAIYTAAGKQGVKPFLKLE